MGAHIAHLVYNGGEAQGTGNNVPRTGESAQDWIDKSRNESFGRIGGSGAIMPPSTTSIRGKLLSRASGDSLSWMIWDWGYFNQEVELQFGDPDLEANIARMEGQEVFAVGYFIERPDGPPHFHVERIDPYAGSGVLWTKRVILEGLEQSSAEIVSGLDEIDERDDAAE